MKLLVVIPARGGSKGLPGKNVKLLLDKPLIYYSLDVAREIVKDKDICVTTDDDNIISVVKQYNIDVPFKRPVELASDMATTNDVLLHCVNFFEEQGEMYDTILLLQPTSPLRTKEHIHEALKLYEESPQVNMVASVRLSHASSVLCHEDNGYMVRTLTNASRRQDTSEYYEYNGAIYVININTLKSIGLANFTKVKKYVMPTELSVDIDTLLDWKLTEMMIKEGVVKIGI